LQSILFSSRIGIELSDRDDAIQFINISSASVCACRHTDMFVRNGDLCLLDYSAGFAYFNQTDVDKGVSADRLHRVLRTFVRNVYAYHRQYIYDVLLYQYQQDSVTGSTGRGSQDPAAVRDLLMELIGDAEQVRNIGLRWMVGLGGRTR